MAFTFGQCCELVTALYLTATGLPIPAESLPTGLAAAIHEPFKELTHSCKWSLVDADVDWQTRPGTTVGFQNAGNEQLAGARSVIQRITRELGKGKTTYESGPASHLSFEDLLGLRNFLRGRNSGRNGGSSTGPGYSGGTGPSTKQTGKCETPGSGGGGSGKALWWNVTVYGVPAFAQFDSQPPVSVLPPGAYIQDGHSY